MTEQNYSHRFSRFYPSLTVVVREARALYKGSLCVRFKNVPHDTQGWCIHLYTEQPDRGSRRSGGSEGNTHEDCIHSPQQVGEFGSRVVPRPAEAHRQKTEGERRCWEKRKKDGMYIVAVVAREHRRGREKKRERERETRRQGLSHESSLFSLP